MFQINDDLSIYVTRGDSLYFTVTAQDDGTAYTFMPGDVVRLKVFGKKDAENVVLQKDFPVLSATEKVAIYLTEEETRIGGVISKPTDYWYEVELNPFENPQTIIGYDEDGAKIFKLFPEGNELPDYVPDPGEIPVVDKVLDMTSVRPVQNQAIARAVTRLEAAVKDNKSASSGLAEELTVERRRIDNLLSGATADNAETVDIRVGAKGETYESAGGAVRNQIRQLDGEKAALVRAIYGEKETGTLLGVRSKLYEAGFEERLNGDILYGFNSNFVTMVDTPETTVNGLTYSIKDGVMTLNGTVAEWTSLTIADALPAGLIGSKLYCKIRTSGSTGSALINTKINTQYGNVLSLGGDTTDTEVICEGFANDTGMLFQCGAGETFDNVTIELFVGHDNIGMNNFVAGKRTHLTSPTTSDLLDYVTTKLGSTIYLKAGEADHVVYRSDIQENVNPLYGKRVYADGDSVMAGAGGTSFINQIATNNKMVLNNAAVSGTTLTVGTTGTSITERVLSMSGEYDFIVLCGGYNDVFALKPLGEITAAYNGKYNDGTVVGAVETICKFLVEHYPETKKLFVLGHRLLNANGDLYSNNIQDAYWKSIATALEKWGIPYVDIRKNGGFACYNRTWLSEYFGEGETMGTHPNEKGYSIGYVNQVESAMKNL